MAKLNNHGLNGKGGDELDRKWMETVGDKIIRYTPVKDSQTPKNPGDAIIAELMKEKDGDLLAPNEFGICDDCKQYGLLAPVDGSYFCLDCKTRYDDRLKESERIAKSLDDPEEFQP